MPADQTPHAPKPSWVVRMFKPLASAWVAASRFRIEGAMPDLPKYVIIAAPHKSNWDFPHALAAGVHYGLRIHWMGKDALFRWPIGGVMRWLGGIAVDRSKTNNAVQSVVDRFKAEETFHLVITPEGTRKDVVRWKSGFYHIATAANVPIVLAFIDYKRRRVGFGGIVVPTGNYEADLATIQAIYQECADGKR